MAQKNTYGALAQFQSASEVYKACEKVRDSGFKHWDAHTPFPVHGLEKAMGLSQSKLPLIVGAVSLICGLGSYLLWSWMNAVDYKFIIAGKPFYSWPTYFLPGFECAVLSAAITCLIGMLVLNRLPQWYHALLNVDIFKEATNDKFFISIESADPKFDEKKTLDFLKSLGATQVVLVEK